MVGKSSASKSKLIKQLNELSSVVAQLSELIGSLQAEVTSLHQEIEKLKTAHEDKMISLTKFVESLKQGYDQLSHRIDVLYQALSETPSEPISALKSKKTNTTELIIEALYELGKRKGKI